MKETSIPTEAINGQGWLGPGMMMKVKKGQVDTVGGCVYEPPTISRGGMGPLHHHVVNNYCHMASWRAPDLAPR